jgi:Flp pilus assembly protein TadD
VFLALAAVTFLAFAPALDAGFVDYDDDIYVSANSHIQHGFNATSVRWALTSFYASNWHPLTWLSHMIDWSMWRSAPAGHHAMSVLIHLAASLALYVGLERLTGSIIRSAIVAALFAIHPLHVESVAWLAERKDVLCALFWFLAIAAYARSRMLAVVLLGAAALMAKPMAVTLPLTLLLLDYWPRGHDLRVEWPAALREKAPLFALAAGASLLTVMAQRASHSIATVAAVPLGQRFANAAVAATWYLVKALWPTGLAVFYPHPRGSLELWKVAVSVVALTAITITAIRLRKTRPYLLFGWLWYLITLLPVIGIVQVGEQAMADRYSYVPLVGIFVAVTWGAWDAIASAIADVRRARALAMSAAAIAIAVLIAVTRIQAGFWKSSETLFTHALAVTKDNDVAHAHLGMLRAAQHRLPEADAHFREALRIRPSDALSHLDLGANLVQMGKDDEALVEFRVALSLDPRDPRVRTNLGGLLERRGDLAGAQAEFSEAIRLDPSFTSARLGLGTVASAQGRLDDAATQFNEVLKADPANADAHDRLATVLAQLHRYDEAYTHFAESIRIDRNRADTQCNWGTALATQGRYRDAAAHFAEAVRIDPALARAHFSLAAASLYLEDYGTAWREAKLAQAHGLTPPPEFLSMLAAKMPEPR